MLQLLLYMGLFIVSFVAGVLTILAPCILPLLPVIVGRSVSDTTLSSRRVLVVVVSLGLSVILFTLILKASTFFINIPQDFWKYVSGGIIFIFGLVTVFPSLWDTMSFTSKINEGSNKVLMSGYRKNSIWGDVIIGASLGPIFSACSPTYFVILATVLPVRPALGMLYLATYTLGLCLSLLIVSVLGQKIMTKLNIATDSHGWFKRTLGVLFMLVGVGICTGYDKTFQISILDAGFFDVTKVEQKLLDKNTNSEVLPSRPLDTVPSQGGEEKFLTLTQKKAKFVLAPDISTPDGFVNTDGKPVSISEFKGKKVVLLDIWTYSCINCERTLPYLKEWYKKYKDQGLVIIGLHTPEFSFERVQKNVEDAVKRFGIEYPVVLDNDFSTWNAFQNQFWPRHYLIDIDGYIVQDHAGEGAYAETETAIQEALLERNDRLNTAVKVTDSIADPKEKIIVDPNKVGSPETYFGSARNGYLANGNAGVAGIQTLTLPSSTNVNSLYLDGTWSFLPEYATNTGAGTVVFKYNSKNVYMVASSKEGADVDVYIDGKFNHTVHIKDEMLYDIVKGSTYGAHTLMLKIKTPGIDAFTFTFG